MDFLHTLYKQPELICASTFTNNKKSFIKFQFNTTFIKYS